MNICILSGHITRNPEVKYIPGSGTPVANTAIATKKRYKDKNGKYVEKTTFIDVAAFGGLASVFGEHVVKGQKVTISGELVQQQWEQNGQKRSKHQIHVNELDMHPRSQMGMGGDIAHGDDVPY